MDLRCALEELNQRLAQQGTRLRLEQRGQRLNLRGPLPDRRDPQANRIQRISLGLGADRQGLAEAEQTLLIVLRQLERGQFRWEDWPRSSASYGKSRRTASDAIEDFERAFFADPRRRRSPAGSRTTWTSAYRPYLRRLLTLSGDGEITAQRLTQTLSSYGDGSRSRQQCATALAALAAHLMIELPQDWRRRLPDMACIRPGSGSYPRTPRSSKGSCASPTQAGDWPTD